VPVDEWNEIPEKQPSLDYSLTVSLVPDAGYYPINMRVCYNQRRQRFFFMHDDPILNIIFSVPTLYKTNRGSI